MAKTRLLKQIGQKRYRLNWETPESLVELIAFFGFSNYIHTCALVRYVYRSDVNKK